MNTVWPDWKTVGILGRGSFGTVYEIERDVFGHLEKAALKVISIPQNSSDMEDLYNDGYDRISIAQHFESYLKDIVREYSLMAEMKGCNNIVHCDDLRYVPHDDGLGWDIHIKMELLTPLPKAFGRRFPEEQVIRLGVDICNALAACKGRNIVHRDIKPQNIFVSEDGTYKLGDFGIAKTAERTTRGTKTGTYKYMAPEVYNDQPYGSSADIYSLGLVLYWLLNQRRTPFLPLPPQVPTAAMEEEARRKRFDAWPIPKPIHGSEPLKRIVLKACAFSPASRYSSAAEMKQDLEALLYGQALPQDLQAVIPGIPDSQEYGGTTFVESQSVMGRSRKILEDAFAPYSTQNAQLLGKKRSLRRFGPVGILTAIGLLSLGFYFFIHIWNGPGCMDPQACVICGKTRGAIQDHSWQPATCTESQICRECGASGAAATGHDWQPATCTREQFCLECGAVEGSPMGHDWGSSDRSFVKVCQICGTKEQGVDTVAVGDTIVMGRYEQDNNGENGQEAVEWIVLAAEGDRALVISRDCLECMPYKYTFTATTWEDSDLRFWLNNAFLQTAFEPHERSRILQTTVTTPNNANSGKKGGRDTVDHLFVLSREEVYQYLLTGSAAQSSQPSPSALAKGAGSRDVAGLGRVFWWTRTPGRTQYSALVASCDYGYVTEVGDNVNTTDVTVRPAMWIDISPEDLDPQEGQ